MPEKSSASDVDIILYLQEQDPEPGLRMLLDTHGGKVLGLLKKKYKSVLDEDELKSSMNLAAYMMLRFAPRWDESKGTVAGCFFVFARNAAVSALRKEQRHYENRTDFEEILRAEDSNGTPCDPLPPEAKRSKLFEDFDRAVAELNGLQKAIIDADLKADGLAHAGRLAESLGSTTNSIYANRNKAHESIKKRMIQLGHYRE